LASRLERSGASAPFDYSVAILDPTEKQARHRKLIPGPP